MRVSVVQKKTSEGGSAAVMAGGAAAEAIAEKASVSAREQSAAVWVAVERATAEPCADGLV